MCGRVGQPLLERIAMIKQAEKDYIPRELEIEYLHFWERTKAYEKTKKLRNNGEDYYFLDGPPYTTGSIHLGTAWNKIIKDMLIRYLRMHGYNVRDQPGFDMHGLPIEVQVERSLGIMNKKQIEELGIKKFVETCRDFACRFQEKMSQQFGDLGVWMDWDNPYRTIENSYIESAWWTIKKAHEKGLLEKSQRVLQWCPRCETALAEAEIEYYDETDPSIYVKFPLQGKENESILVWTTTPWTIPANLAVAVNPAFTYAKVLVVVPGRREFIWMMEDNVKELGEYSEVLSYEIIEKVPGEQLSGLKYRHPLISKVPYLEEIRGEWVHKVLLSDTVTEENTGCVHIAPGHGPEDFDIGLKYGLPPFCPVDERGYFTSEAGEYRGTHVRESNARIIGDLKQMGSLFRESEVVHRYGHCWRCNTPIIYRSTEQWFLKITRLRERMLDEVEKIDWTPAWAGSSRQYDWVQDARDWCISRQRYWGIPLPIWTCECGEIKVIGSREELSKGENYREDVDLHRPSIDAITFKCPSCGKEMRRVQDVLDVWFDAGVCSWAQLNYPSLRDEFKRWWPAKWITEAHDQTRGWFYSQLGLGVLAFNRSPYESVLMHGFMNDPNGQPLSKSKGNMIEPFDIVEKYGADALRLYVLKANAPWEDINFQIDEVETANRRLNILWNVHKFATTYMFIDNFDPEKYTLKALSRHLKPEDRWLLSRVEKLKIVVEDEMKKYNLHRASRELESFIVDDLSRWYVRLVRDRTWLEGEDLTKYAAYKALYEALLAATKMLAPIAPFICEAIYQNLDGRLLSIHMCDWPAPDESLIDSNLEKQMKIVQNMVEVVSKARQKQGLKLRWPVRSITIQPADKNVAKASKVFSEVFKRQTNCKDLKVLGPGEKYDGWVLVVRPKQDIIGRAYKQWSSKIATMLETRPPETVKREIEKGEYIIGIEGQVIRIEPNMIELGEKLPKHVVEVACKEGTLFIDMETTPEIRAEGFAKEIVRRIQEMRKEIDLDVEDFIKTKVKARPDLLKLLLEWKDYIAKETRSREFWFSKIDVDEEYVVEWNIEGEVLSIGVTPLFMKEATDAFTSIPGITEKKAVALFDAGYLSLSSLELASTDELEAIEGLDELDVRRIQNYLSLPEDERRAQVSKCPYCGAELSPEDTTCKRCGEALGEERFYCPECKGEIPPGAEVCYHCGAKIKEAEPEKKKEEIEELQRIPGIGEEKAEQLLESGLNYGELSRMSIAELEKVEVISENLAILIADHFGKVQHLCPLCGAVVDAKATECPRCGTSFVVEEAAVEKRVEEVAETPEAQEELKAAAESEEKAAAVALPELRESFSYLVKEGRSEHAYELLIQTIRSGRPGFCVTRVYPSKIREKYDIGDLPILWLSNVGKENSVRPKDLEKLSLSLEQFITKKAGIVLLDGIEYLITNNNFITVLRLIQSLRDQIAINGSILLISVNPSTLDEHQLNLLEREVDSVISPSATGGSLSLRQSVS